MSPQIRNPRRLDLPPGAEAILAEMFPGFQAVVIKDEFSALSYSGSRVYRVHLLKEGDVPELPLVVKIAPASLIKQEVQAYRDCVRHQWPGVAELRGEPVFLGSSDEGNDLAGLCYALMGGGVFQMKSLREYCLQAGLEDVSFVLEERLFRMMEKRMLRPARNAFEFPLRSSYDALLPVNLLVKPRPLSSDETPTLVSPEALLLLEERNVRLALVLDPFDSFCQTATLWVLDGMRGLRDSFKATLSYLAGLCQELDSLRDPMEMGALYEILDSHQCWLGAMQAKNARWVIRQVEATGRSFAQAEIERLIKVTGSYPSLLRAASLWLAKASSSPSTKAWADCLLAERSVRHRLEEIWSGLTEEEQQTLSEVQKLQPLLAVHQDRTHSLQTPLHHHLAGYWRAGGRIPIFPRGSAGIIVRWWK